MLSRLCFSSAALPKHHRQSSGLPPGCGADDPPPGSSPRKSCRYPQFLTGEAADELLAEAADELVKEAMQ